ncbi:MAG: response regulator [Rickettsiales bacterium]
MSGNKIKNKGFIKLLAVEDCETFAVMLKECLTGIEGMRVEKHFASDMKKAMERFREKLPDAVLLDIVLPDGNGLDLIQEMLEIKPDTKIIIVTGSDSHDNIKIAKERGAVGYILKPYNRQQIIEILRKIYEQDQPTSSDRVNKINTAR